MSLKRAASWILVAMVLCAVSWSMWAWLPDRVAAEPFPIATVTWSSFPILGLAWAVLAAISLRRTPLGATQWVVALFLVLIWVLVGVVSNGIDDAVDDLSAYSRSELGGHVTLAEEPGLLLRFPSPYAPPSERDFWRGVTRILEIRRYVGDAPGATEVSHLYAGLERLNARIGAGDAATADLERMISPSADGLLTRLVRAKLQYASGDLQGALEEVERAESLALSYPSADRKEALFRVQTYALYYEAAAAASSGNLEGAGKLLEEYAELGGRAHTAVMVREDPVFAAFRESAAYDALLKSVQ